MTIIPYAQRGILITIAISSALSIWGAIYPQNTWLQVGPVLLALPLVVWLLRRWPLSNTAAGCLASFILLHLLAACWSYSFVPYDAWGNAISGCSIDAVFGFQRNMFDRLVHLLFGMLMICPISEIAMRYAHASKGFALTFAVLFVFAFSSIYEIFEWSLTMTLSPADAGAYNGEQGDPFDSQKDMLMATSKNSAFPGGAKLIQSG